MALNRAISFQKINLLSINEFVDVFKNVLENSPEAAEQVALKRPFSNVGEVEDVFVDFLDQLSDDEKEIILRKHPQLKGTISEENLTLESKNEQQSAGINKITNTDKCELIKLNELYINKFSFPFVICARENNVGSIIQAIESRLKNPKEMETAVGIAEVKKIIKFRIHDLIQ